jgi:hypothetical protein
VHSVLADRFVEQFDLQAIAPSPVPLPAAGWLLIAAVGGLGALRARKAA